MDICTVVTTEEIPGANSGGSSARFPPYCGCPTKSTGKGTAPGIAEKGLNWQAGVAQWQSSGFVNRRSWVRLPSPAPLLSYIIGRPVDDPRATGGFRQGGKACLQGLGQVSDGTQSANSRAIHRTTWPWRQPGYCFPVIGIWGSPFSWQVLHMPAQQYRD